MATPNSKIVANKSKERNKKPLQNKVYKIDIIPPKTDNPDLQKYMFKDLGLLFLYWGYEKENSLKTHGFITPEAFKELIGEKQWGKFCQGKREFTVQRRINGKNISKRNY